uniref:Uncharacterized protein n=1 Tax=Solanum tuberosum TaxID=4113 RepID=M1DSP7_SOLTU
MIPCNSDPTSAEGLPPRRGQAAKSKIQENTGPLSCQGRPDAAKATTPQHGKLARQNVNNAKFYFLLLPEIPRLDVYHPETLQKASPSLGKKEEDILA